METKAFESLATRLKPRLLERAGRLLRIAAMLAVTLCIGAMAAIGYTSVSSESRQAPEVSEVSAHSISSTNSASSKSSGLSENITFDNIPLSEIARQLSETFGCTVVFADKAAEDIRLYFTIPKGSTAADFVAIIDDYDTLAANIKDNTITIKLQEGQQ